ncbi:unnamed protein product [Effrenium voratum]|nr:unnamed protein product [Effrenium voratum]
MLLQLRLVGPPGRQELNQAFQRLVHHPKLPPDGPAKSAFTGAGIEALVEADAARPPARPALPVPSTAELARQLADMEKAQAETLRLLPTDQPPARRVARPSHADPDHFSFRGCDWHRHAGTFLGEHLGAGLERSLVDAQEMCADAGAACAGVTCAAPATRCTARRGLPYLAKSPTQQEVSFTKTCPDFETAPPTARSTPSSPTQGAVTEPARASQQALRPEELPVVVIAHNRPDCLEKCLKALAELEEVQQVRVAVSLDDPASFGTMEAVVHKFMNSFAAEIWHKTAYVGDRGPLHSNTAVSKISEHFRFALAESFGRRGFEFAVFLENDLLVAPDFLWLFRASAWLLKEDPSLFCVSAWNDNGVPSLVSNEKRLFRTDYFPGLGWMIQNTTWSLLKEEWPRFPSTGWDHWLRHGSGLFPRECIVPEVSRTHHFDTRGTNVKAGSSMAKKLSGMSTSKLKPKELGDLSYLLSDRYEEELRASLHQAIEITEQNLPALARNQVYLLPFLRRDYKKLAARLQLTEAQPRTGHRGVIDTRDPRSGARLFLVDRAKSSNLPVAQKAAPHAKRQVQKAAPAESCEAFCNRNGMHCSDLELEFINNCATLRQHFPCEEGCGHQVGQEIPCYVHDAQKDTGKQCLVTDDAIPLCSAKNAATTGHGILHWWAWVSELDLALH